MDDGGSNLAARSLRMSKQHDIEETVMTSKRILGLTMALTAALSVPVVLAGPAAASGGGGDVRAAGACTNGPGVWKL